MTNEQKKQFARSLVVMTAASTGDDEFNNILKLASKHQIKSVHIDQLAVSLEESNSRIRLLNALKHNVIH